ncbi:type II secretion system inner membrane protein GspF [uncultured Desulfobacter sp.]|uniref:type II secretion system inner membrane protein GspF n=1 Tax=uncultured Desulfobacter sp. TaxID=240139 RepID=UPI002AABC9CD|nr:type II secretion system inner membrane protein GspF [uncultured Desulfobacter sp.]
MAVFEYSGLTASGKKKSGIIDAENPDAAQDELKLKGIFPTSILRIESGAGRIKTGEVPSKEKAFTLPAVFSSVKSSEITMITRQLATLLAAGFPLLKAVATLVPQARSKVFKRVLSRVKDAIEEGNSFADALGAHPQVFSAVYINMVKAGEASGTLEVVLERLADFNEKREDTKKKIQASLAYPVLMAAIGFLVLVFLLTFIVPNITKIFTDMNHELPMPTQILLSISGLVQSWWWLIIPSPFLALLGLYAIRKTDKGGWILDRIILSLPIFGSLNRQLIASRFSRTLGSLLDNGVPLLTALGITKTISGNRVITQLIEKAAQTVEQGGSLGSVLEKNSAFPDLAAQMIKVGEKSGEMEKMLEKSAELFERNVQTVVTAATSIIEPLIILVMGVVIGFIILAVCLPIFEINQIIG